MYVLMSVFPEDLKTGVSKMLPNQNWEHVQDQFSVIIFFKLCL